nr:MAG TPA: hypothetical protein [Caudoviricetes sp.]
MMPPPPLTLFHMEKTGFHSESSAKQLSSQYQGSEKTIFHAREEPL